MNAWPLALSLLMLCTGGAYAADPASPPRASSAPAWFAQSAPALEDALVKQHGEAQRARIRQGLHQAAVLWRDTDGDRAAFEAFAREAYAGDDATRDALFARFERNLEVIDGHLQDIGRELRAPVDLDTGPVRGFDESFAAYDPGAHVSDDFFANKLAFTALLNFPQTTLAQRIAQGDGWTRRQWAETRLAERFARRVPAQVTQAVSDAATASATKVAGYNLWMHHVVDARGQRLFAPGTRLLSHWNLRDAIKAGYADPVANLPKQRAIALVMSHIVLQTIPESVIDNPRVDWNPWDNTVVASSVDDAGGIATRDAPASDAREPDTRYRMLLGDFRAERGVDAYSPGAPSLIARRFDEERQIPEARVEAMLEQVLSAPQAREVAALVQQRLGRALEPFDIWYDGFRAEDRPAQDALDAATRTRYPTAAAYAADMPRMLQALGFTGERARSLSARIVVEPARGSGHALGAGMRGVPVRLRTRVGAGGMDYQGYNIAVHEMGHNVEQLFSLDGIDHTLLAGVPNTAFTEALAFVFQARDLELLGMSRPGARDDALRTLGDFWATYEIAGVGLVDMRAWRWMYAHPDATPAQLREAVAGIARDVWNRYYAPLLGGRDSVLLGVYSHMIDSFLYLPDYALGRMIAFQIGQRMAALPPDARGAEFERMATIGRLTPDAWMRQATGQPVGADALLDATTRALATVRGDER